MQIKPQEFIALTDKVVFFSEKASLLEKQNTRLLQQNIKFKETVSFLSKRLQQQATKNSDMEKQIIDLIQYSTQNVTKAVQQATVELTQHFQQQIHKIKSDANVQKIRQMQKKMSENRFTNHEMIDFYQKIQNLYLVLNNTKTPPSMPELYKWATLRKSDELVNNNMSAGNTFLGTQKSFLNTSKMNGSKMNISKINEPKMNASRSNIPKMTGSRVNGGNLSLSKAKGQKFNIPKSNAVKFKGNKSPKGKENQRGTNKTPPAGKKKNKNGDMEIMSTESFTQNMNVDNFSLVNTSEKILSITQNKESVVNVKH